MRIACVEPAVAGRPPLLSSEKVAEGLRRLMEGEPRAAVCKSLGIGLSVSYRYWPVRRRPEAPRP